MFRKLARKCAFTIAFVLVSPLISSEWFCRLFLRRSLLFKAQAQWLSLFPGMFGSCLRTAYYRFTLTRCPSSVTISFGSMFTHPEAELGEAVYIGSRCILGMVSIGDKTMLADAVYVLSGKRQHGTNSGVSYQDQAGTFTQVAIGRNCWIGTNTVIMANVGDDSIVGAGSVVTKDLPANSRAVGNPARDMRMSENVSAPST